MKTLSSIATLFIAACALSTGAWGQTVYRCGGTYSDVPCAGAVTVDAQDSRTPAQQRESEATTTREAAAANTLEKERLAQEAQALTERKAAAKAAKKTAAKSKKAKTPPEPDAHGPAAGEIVAVVGSPNHRAKKKKTQEYFTAHTVAEKKKNPAD